MRRREPEPVAEQDREDAARRADQARSDAEYLTALGVRGTVSGTETSLTAPTLVRRDEVPGSWELAEFPEWFVGQQVDLDPEADKILRDNLWDLYTEWTSPEPELAPDTKPKRGE